MDWGQLLVLDVELEGLLFLDLVDDEWGELLFTALIVSSRARIGGDVCSRCDGEFKVDWGQLLVLGVEWGELLFPDL